MKPVYDSCMRSTRFVMKALIFSIPFFAVLAEAAPMNAVWASRLEKIQNEVRRCTQLPFVVKPNGQKQFSTLINRCADIELSAPVQGRSQQARIRTPDGFFAVDLIETAMTDGDIYDVRILDLSSRTQIILPAVFAYRDVLLGALGGDLNGVEHVERR